MYIFHAIEIEILREDITNDMLEVCYNFILFQGLLKSDQ